MLNTKFIFILLSVCRKIPSFYSFFNYSIKNLEIFFITMNISLCQETEHKDLKNILCRLTHNTMLISKNVTMKNSHLNFFWKSISLTLITNMINIFENHLNVQMSITYSDSWLVSSFTSDFVHNISIIWKIHAHSQGLTIYTVFSFRYSIKINRWNY